jgi:hypothetical protein
MVLAKEKHPMRLLHPVMKIYLPRYYYEKQAKRKKTHHSKGRKGKSINQVLKNNINLFIKLIATTIDDLADENGWAFLVMLAIYY